MFISKSHAMTRDFVIRTAETIQHHRVSDLRWLFSYSVFCVYHRSCNFPSFRHVENLLWWCQNNKLTPNTFENWRHKRGQRRKAMVYLLLVNWEMETFGYMLKYVVPVSILNPRILKLAKEVLKSEAKPTNNVIKGATWITYLQEWTMRIVYAVIK